jgi:cytochrome c oxidase assembly factor CtaG
MLQHILLILVAAPLLAAAAPLSTVLQGLPGRLASNLGQHWKAAQTVRSAWQAASHPVSAWSAHLLVLLIWHVPVFYEAALATEWLHQLEHVAMFGTGWLFWWVCIHPSRRSAWLRGPGGAFLVFTLALPTGLLGALMTLSASAWYETYRVSTPTWGLSALADQQLAGAVMWVPAGLIYLAVALIVLAVWLRTEERNSGAQS